jgi:hypothetical protein
MCISVQQNCCVIKCSGIALRHAAGDRVPEEQQFFFSMMMLVCTPFKTSPDCCLKVSLWLDDRRHEDQHKWVNRMGRYLSQSLHSCWSHSPCIQCLQGKKRLHLLPDTIDKLRSYAYLLTPRLKSLRLVISKQRVIEKYKTSASLTCIAQFSIQIQNQRDLNLKEWLPGSANRSGIIKRNCVVRLNSPKMNLEPGSHVWTQSSLRVHAIL